MKLKIVLASCVLLVASFVVFSIPAPISHAQGTTKCTISNFDLSILQGPNKGLDVVGELSMEAAADGSLNGSLKSTTGATIPMLGQITGRAVDMAFNMGKAPNGKFDRYVFGTGLMLNGFKGCGDAPFGGTAVGPDLGDSGEWGCNRPGCGPNGSTCCPGGAAAQ